MFVCQRQAQFEALCFEVVSAFERIGTSGLGRIFKELFCGDTIGTSDNVMLSPYQFLWLSPALDASNSRDRVSLAYVQLSYGQFEGELARFQFQFNY